MSQISMGFDKFKNIWAKGAVMAAFQVVFFGNSMEVEGYNALIKADFETKPLQLKQKKFTIEKPKFLGWTIDLCQESQFPSQLIDAGPSQFGISAKVDIAKVDIVNDVPQVQTNVTVDLTLSPRQISLFRSRDSQTPLNILCTPSKSTSDQEKFPAGGQVKLNIKYHDRTTKYIKNVQVKFGEGFEGVQIYEATVHHKGAVDLEILGLENFKRITNLELQGSPKTDQGYTSTIIIEPPVSSVDSAKRIVATVIRARDADVRSVTTDCLKLWDLNTGEWKLAGPQESNTLASKQNLLKRRQAVSDSLEQKSEALRAQKIGGLITNFQSAFQDDIEELIQKDSARLWQKNIISTKVRGTKTKGNQQSNLPRLQSGGQTQISNAPVHSYRGGLQN